MRPGKLGARVIRTQYCACPSRASEEIISSKSQPKNFAKFRKVANIVHSAALLPPLSSVNSGPSQNTEVRDGASHCDNEPSIVLWECDV
jgi:hypothetical protein